MNLYIDFHMISRKSLC